MALTNHVLVALPNLKDPNFAQSYIQICSHSPAGAMGFCLNKPMEKPVAESLMQSIHLDKRAVKHIYWGGPVHLDTVHIIHDPTYSTVGTKNYGDYSVSRDRQCLRDINADLLPGNYKVFLGHCTWAPTQLEHEIYVRKNWSHFVSDKEWLYDGQLEWEDAILCAGNHQAVEILDRAFQ